MTIKTPITTLTMSDDSTVSVPEGGVVVFVGPNNAGKSVTLHDIFSLLAKPQKPVVAATKVEVAKEGDEEQLLRWLEDNCYRATTPHGEEVFAKGGHQVPPNSAQHWWRQGPPYQQLGSLFALHAAGEGRLQAARGVEHIDAQKQAPQHPLHSLALDSELTQRISDISRRAFGFRLTLSQFGGKMLYLHLGLPEADPGPASRPNPEYVNQLRELPTLDEQGDGMKSFMGLALQLFASNYPFVLVDEPEAFLHPPQARLLGRMLADEKRSESQVFVGTHDSDVLRGLLDAEGSEVTVVRLRRDGKVNLTSQLEAQVVQELWRDPLLRYSNILDGLFHEGVILCEGDADCRFYNSILDVLEGDENSESRPDLMFTHCGGKDRMPSVLQALRAVEVPTRVVADFDVLRGGDTLKKIVKELDGNWTALEGDWKVVSAALDSGAKTQKANVVREQVDEVLDSRGYEEIQSADAEKIKKIIRPQGRWEEAKRSGSVAVPAGEPRTCLDRLLEGLRSRGLYVLEVGELENFVPTVTGHGPSWVAEVHARRLHLNSELTRDAREFITKLVSSLKHAG